MYAQTECFFEFTGGSFVRNSASFYEMLSRIELFKEEIMKGIFGLHPQIVYVF